MDSRQFDFNSPEGKVLVRELHAFTAVHFSRLYRRDVNERGKSIADYVSEAIEKHLTGEDNYDPTRAKLGYHLKHNVIKRSIYNDLPPHVKKEYREDKQKSVTETNLMPGAFKMVEPAVAPQAMGSYDADVLFEEVGKRTEGDSVVQQIVEAIWFGGFELSSRAAICGEYSLSESDFDKGKKRFMTALGNAFKSLNWHTEQYDRRQK